jgi:uncharacterized membrane protein YsdA (DUF1294 family)
VAIPGIGLLQQGWSFIRSMGGNVMGGVADGERPDEVAVPQTRFDRAISGISRLPRLLMLFGAMAILAWPIFDVVGFKAWAEAVALTPENVWLLIFMVFGSWATTKAMRDFRGKTRKGLRIGTGQERGYGNYSGMDDYTDYGRLGNAMDPDPMIHDTTDSHNDRIEAWKNQLP